MSGSKRQGYGGGASVIRGRKPPSLPLKFSVTVLNALNTPYLYRFKSTFGETHFGVPRTVAGRLDVTN